MSHAKRMREGMGEKPKCLVARHKKKTLNTHLRGILGCPDVCGLARHPETNERRERSVVSTCIREGRAGNPIHAAVPKDASVLNKRGTRARTHTKKTNPDRHPTTNNQQPTHLCSRQLERVGRHLHLLYALLQLLHRSQTTCGRR